MKYETTTATATLGPTATATIVTPLYTSYWDDDNGQWICYEKSHD